MNEIEMKSVKTSELVGEALDWAVAKALGWQMVRVPGDIDGANDSEVIAPPDFSKDFKFPPHGAIPAQYFLRRWSTDWSHGGPLIEKLMIDIEVYASSIWVATIAETALWMPSGTPLIAACRAIVAANLGDSVQVPAELVGGEG